MKEGVLRIPGDLQEATKIVEDFNSNQDISLSSLIDPLSVASALKLYIRSHGKSLLGKGCWEEIKNSQTEPSEFPKLLVSLLDKTSSHHKTVLRRLVELLVYISDHQQITKMNASNLGYELNFENLLHLTTIKKHTL